MMMVCGCLTEDHNFDCEWSLEFEEWDRLTDEEKEEIYNQIL